jgi:hypothetical protein
MVKFLKRVDFENGGREAQKFLDVVVRPENFFSKRGVLKLFFKMKLLHKILWFKIFNFVA